MIDLLSLEIPDGLLVETLLEAITGVTNTTPEELTSKMRRDRVKDAKALFAHECKARGCRTVDIAGALGLTTPAAQKLIKKHKERMSFMDYAQYYKQLKEEIG